MKKGWHFSYFLIIMLAWLPYWWSFYPIIISYDGAAQLANFFGLTYPNNHQPYTAAFLMGLLVKFFMKLTHESTLAFALYASFIAIVSAFVLSRLAFKLGCSFGKKIEWFAVGLFALFPLFPFYAISYDKTSPFLIGTAMLLTALISIAESKKINNHLLELFVGSILISAFRTDGYYVIVIVLFVSSILLKSKKKLWGLLLIIFSMSIISKVIFPNMYVMPGLPGDPISVPLQQVAYTVKKHESHLEKNKLYVELNEIIPLKKITQAYNPNLADYVKFSYGNKYYDTNKSQKKAFEDFLKEKKKYSTLKFARLWLALGKKYPFDYVKAWWYQVDSYYMPTNYDEQQKSSGQLFMNFNKNWVNNSVINTMKQLNMPINYNNSNFAKKFRSKVTTPLKNNNFIYKFLFSAWLYDWVLILSAIIAIIQIIKKKISIVWLLPFLFPLGILGVAMLTPVDGGMRYILPIIMTLPMGVGFIFRKNKETENG